MFVPDLPQGVPSAQGMACDRHPSSGLSPDVTHQSELHSGCAGRGEEVFSGHVLIGTKRFLGTFPVHYTHHVRADFTSVAVDQLALLVLIEFLSGQFGVAGIWFNDAVRGRIQHATAVVVPEGGGAAPVHRIRINHCSSFMRSEANELHCRWPEEDRLRVTDNGTQPPPPTEREGINANPVVQIDMNN